MSEAEYLDAVLGSVPESYRAVVLTLASHHPDSERTDDYIASRL